jgi:hypothetical protein
VSLGRLPWRPSRWAGDFVGSGGTWDSRCTGGSGQRAHVAEVDAARARSGAAASRGTLTGETWQSVPGQGWTGHDVARAEWRARMAGTGAARIGAGDGTTRPVGERGVRSRITGDAGRVCGPGPLRKK